MTGNSLYIHVPFCTHKCGYCHFYVIPNREDYKSQYSRALKKEISLKKKLLFAPLTTLYFGGGTPALMPASFFKDVIESLPLKKNAEITIEANPETLTKETLKELYQAGINRLSIGVQAFQKNLLSLLERTHCEKQAIECIEWANQVGFDNISIDLMFDLPEQRLSDWSFSLDTAFSLPITHLSLYNLTIEPHTGFYKRRKHLKLPSDELSLKMLNLALQKAESYGWERYEISAFCKSGFRSQHNTGYWTGRPFLGLGPSASSFWNSQRFRNQTRFHQWIKGVEGDLPLEEYKENLSKRERIKELFALQLRLINTPFSPPELPIKELIAEGWIESTSEGVFLTEKGKLFHDTVASYIMAL